MEFKVNIEYTIRVLEKNGFEIDNKKDAKVETALTANKKVVSKDSGKFELFQVRCSSPYVKFDSMSDNEMQQDMINALNQGLNNLMRGAHTLTVKQPK